MGMKEALQFWRPAIENIRSTGINLTKREVDPLLEPGMFMTMAPVEIGYDARVCDREGNVVLLPVVVEGLDPIEATQEMGDWNYEYRLKNEVPAVFGSITEDDSMVDPVLPWLMYEDVQPFLYWGVIPLKDGDVDAISALSTSMSNALRGAGLELYQWLQMNFECGDIDPEWAYQMKTGGRVTDYDRHMMDTYGYPDADEETIEVAAEIWFEFLLLEESGGLEDAIPPLRTLAGPREKQLISRLLNQHRTHTGIYSRRTRTPAAYYDLTAYGPNY